MFGYFYKRVLMGKPASEVALVWNITKISVNAIISAVVAVIIYMALRGVLREKQSVSYIKIKDNEKVRAGTVRCSAFFGKSLVG